jgi:VWFA-related protein
MMHDRILAPLLLAAVLAVPFAHGQRRTMPGTLDPAKAKPAPEPPKPEPPPITDPLLDGPIIRATVQVVLVPTTVTDRAGRIVDGLQPQDFRLLDNDKPQDINRDVTALPLSMVICIQRSYNVEGVLPKINRMGNALRDLLIGQDGEAAIVSFDHRIETLADFTNDPDKINEAMRKLRPGGLNSRLNDAVQQAIRMLRYKRDRRKVILMISETLDRSSEANPREVATELQVHNIDFYTLNISRIVTALTTKSLPPRPDPFPPGARPRPGIVPMDPTTTAQWTGMQGYAGDLVPMLVEMFRGVKAIFIRNPAELYTQFTGGREYSFISQADLESAIGKIGEELRGQYILSYTPNNKIEGGFHRIEVQVLRPNLRVRTRPGYWMAGVPD